jgi:hypothetical protein
MFDLVILADSPDSPEYRNPRAVARVLAAAGYKARTVVVVDRDSGLTSTCNYDR